MELKEGMYVRNEKGIAKYLGLGKDVLTINESNQFKHYANQHLFDNCIFDVGHDWGDTLSDDELKNIDKYIEKEPSDNIIDLIKVGDYVNGYKVVDIILTYFNGVDRRKEPKRIGLKVINGKFDYENYIENDEIKNIVTKEQFTSVNYEVE